MADAFTVTAYLAVIAACMANGLTPQQTAIVWQRLETAALPSNVIDAQEWLQQAIDAAKTQ